MKIVSVVSGLIFLLLSSALLAETSVWKVENEGNTLYLGGTIHLLNQQDYPLPEEYDEAFRHSDKLVLETDVKLMQNPKVMAELQTKMMYHDGRTLRSILSTEVYQKLDRYLRSRNLSAMMFDKVKAGSLSITLSVMELQKLGLDQGGVDAHYYKEAEKIGKSLDFLESLEHQISFIANMGEGIEDDMINSTLDDMDSLDTYIEVMKVDWRKGNLNGLDEVAMEDMRKYPSVYQTLIVDRNNAWLTEIEAMLNTPEVESVFVGVLHLVGEDGLIHQLKKRGYRVTQL